MRLLLLLSFTLMLVGCSGSSSLDGKSSSGADREEMKLDMQMLSLTIAIARDEGKGKLPSGVEGLKKYMSGDIVPRIIDKIQSGAIVVNWNSDRSAKWEAYEKDAPIKGGYAILTSHDFKAKEFTAEEVKAALGK
jgi:hypothetical protein